MNIFRKLEEQPVAEKKPSAPKKKLDIFTETVYEVYNPWTAQTLATFTHRRDAELFVERWEKHEKKHRV